MNDCDFTIELLTTLSKTYSSVARIAEKEIKALGLNMTEFEVLLLLAQEGDFAIQELAKQVMLASGSMTYVVDKLSEKGFIEKIICEKDKRRTYIRISEQGRSLIDNLCPAQRPQIQKAFAHLSKTEKENLIDVLQVICQQSQAVFEAMTTKRKDISL